MEKSRLIMMGAPTCNNCGNFNKEINYYIKTPCKGQLLNYYKFEYKFSDKFEKMIVKLTNYNKYCPQWTPESQGQEVKKACDKYKKSLK